jgi:predicted nucleic acid-binding protein
MRDKAFLDTNILIYLYSESEEEKRDTLCRILDNWVRVTSLQALNEASNVWFSKYRWNGEKIFKHLDNVELIFSEILPVSRNTTNIAISLKESYKYSYYDCLMLASALESGCSSILTEDMNNGQIINGVLKIVNPFS